MESTKTPPPIMNQSKQLTEEIGSSKLLTEASRRFYELPVDGTSTSNQTLPNRGDDLFKFIADNVSGKNTTFKGPFGHRKTLYCDYTASGKSLNFIEDYVRDQVLPSYANTHTTTTITALQTTLFRHEARDIIRNAVNATEEDALVFVGSGCTGAVHKLINVMSLQNPPIVFVGPYEHHSNLLPWREIATRVIRINETNNGLVDINHLHVELEQWKSSGRQLIGCFSAASNVTGVMADVDAIAIELHNANALAFFDYATAAPYLEINMNPKSSKGFAHKDAIYFSTHKFVGGVQAPGILVAKKKLFRNAYPTTGGGGTVFYVRRTAHRYLRDIETREEGGTPAIVESIRAGLVFRLKEVTGAQNILEKEHLLVKKAFEKLSRENCPNMILLGPLDQVERLPIFSFMIHNRQTGRLLHYNYVGALLNDVFGIQSRGGCACAGPYAEDLLGIDEDLAEIYENLLLEDSRLDKEFSDKEAFRPGFSRLNLAYFFDEPTVDFILEALRLVAEHGWKLLPQYNLNTHTGEWRHKDNLVFKERVWLSNLNFSPKKHVKARCASKEAPNYTETLIEAQYIFDNYEQYVKTSQPNYNNAYDLDTNQFRWFMTPSDAVRCIKQPSNTPLFKLPFTPAVYPLKIKPEIVLSNVESECEIQEMITKIKNKKLSSHEMMKGNQLKDRMKIDNNNIAGIVKRETKNKLGIASKTFNTNKDNQLLTPDKVSKCEVKAIDNTVKISHNVQWHSPSKDVFKRSVEAILKYNMIRDNDKILVCLSGGKDSLSLLHVIKQYQHMAKSKNVNFTFGAVTIDPGTSSYNPRPLIPYLETLGVPYFYEEQGILEQAENLPYECASICSFCSRMKRGRIYACARREGYNVLALGQHLDDLAESLMMSIFHNGSIRTMKSQYTVKDGDLRVIRPFINVRENQLRHFAEVSNLPVIFENCPACFEAPKERQRVKQMLAQQEILHPRLFASINSALEPLMHINKLNIGQAGDSTGNQI